MAMVIVNGDGELNLKAVLAPVILVVILFTLGLIFEKQLQLHSTPYLVGKYLVFIPAYLLSGLNVLNSAGRNILGSRVFDKNFLIDYNDARGDRCLEVTSSPI